MTTKKVPTILQSKSIQTTTKSRRNIFAAIIACLIWLTTVNIAAAHPEDEFCTPGDESGLDPQLCYALTEIDRAGSVKLSGESLGRGAIETTWIYIGIGIRHILPSGTDHILFVVALFLTTLQLRQLALQISFFTIAHTFTVGLTVAGFISPPPNIVEPLIAASIAFVAIENLVFKGLTIWRPAIVFGFGLLHGMGFAGALTESGIPDDHFWGALIGYNFGVEIGQLTTVAVASLLITLMFLRISAVEKPQYKRRFVAIPGSIAISLIAIFWTIQRIWF